MKPRVILFLVDGMRPDAIAATETPFMDAMMSKGSYSLRAKTVMPSITLPCHISLFFSVPPERHGILTNIYTPMARPVPGLFDVLHQGEFSTASFYNWEQLRDLSAPGALTVSVMMANLHQAVGQADLELTRTALAWLLNHDCDFVFIYLGQTDEVGHAEGWMSEAYLKAVQYADQCMAMVKQSLGNDVNYFVTADHGGHDRHHGSLSDEDMSIPLLMMGPQVPDMGEMNDEVSIMDIAPTILGIFECKTPRVWSGKDLFKRKD